jgi:hypothetical protein
MERQHSSKLIQHLGILAGVCKEIRLAELIDQYVDNGGRKVTVGEAVVAMVLNAMGFTGRPLYLTPRFYESRPVDTLIREGLESKDFHDYSLGTALDALYEQGITELFSLSPRRYWPIRGSKPASPTSTRPPSVSTESTTARPKRSARGWYTSQKATPRIMPQSSCAEDAEKAAQSFSRKLKHLQLEYRVYKRPYYEGKGRPKASSTPSSTSWFIEGQLSYDEQRIEADRLRKGKFIVATNELNHDSLSAGLFSGRAAHPGSSPGGRGAYMEPEEQADR